LRPKYIAGIAIGIFLIYFSIYGLAGFGLTWTGFTSLPVKEDFDSLSGGQTLGWDVTGTPSGNVAPKIVTTFPGATSCAELQASTGKADTRSSMQNYGVAQNALTQNDTYTVQYRLQANFTGSKGWVSFGVTPTDSMRWELSINASYVTNGGAGISQNYYPLAQDNLWHLYTILVTKGSGSPKAETFDVYRDGNKIGTGWTATNNPAWQKIVCIESWNDSLQAHVDYLYFDAGLNPPGPTTASLTVNTQSAGSPLGGVTVSADSVPDQTTNSGGSTVFTLPIGSLQVSVPATFGTYTFNSWSDGGARAHSVTLSEGGLSLTATYNAAPTYSLTIYAMANGGNIGGMSVTVNNGGTPSTKVVTTSGTLFGPFTSASTTAVIDLTYGTYTFNSWNGDGTSTQRGPENLNPGSNSWTAAYTQSGANTYSLTIYAQCNGANIGGMNAVVNTVSKAITTSGTQWGPYTSNAVTASIDQTLGSYTFSYWLVNGNNVGTSPPTTLANVGMNTWTAVYTQGGGTTYTLTVWARANSKDGSAMSGMNAMINGETKQIASSGTTWGPYTSPTVTGATIDGSFNSYTFRYWSVNGVNMGSSPPTILTAGSNSWIAVYVSASPPPNTDWFAQIWAWIQTNILNNPTAQKGELIVGSLMVIISSICLFLPGKKSPIQYILGPRPA
jgi:hypothetical protein